MIACSGWLWCAKLILPGFAPPNQALNFTSPCLLPLPVFVCIQWPCLLWHCFPPELLQHYWYKPFSSSFHSVAAIWVHWLSPFLCWPHWSHGVALRTSTKVRDWFYSVILKNGVSGTVMCLQEVGSPFTWPLHQQWAYRVVVPSGLLSPTVYHSSWTPNFPVPKLKGSCLWLVLVWPELVSLLVWLGVIISLVDFFFFSFGHSFFMMEEHGPS